MMEDRCTRIKALGSNFFYQFANALATEVVPVCSDEAGIISIGLDADNILGFDSN